MAEVKNLEQAKDAFATLCRFFDKNEWNYKKDEEKLSIECGVQGDDLPMKFMIRVVADKMHVMLLSLIPFTVQEDKRIDVAIAVSAVNNALVVGCFDYNVTTGDLLFRMTNSYRDSILSEEVFEFMLFSSCKIVEEYNDKFLMISKGMLPIEQFLSTLAN